MLNRYSIRDEIYRGRTRIVFRAVRDADDMAVIIKTVGTDVPTADDVAELRREYEILSGLSIDGVVKAHEFYSEAGAVQLILEDRGGLTLAKHLQSDLDLPACLRVALEITSVLAELHDNSVLHKDINPGNILVDPTSGKITLIDFSISTRLAEEHHSVFHPNVLEGTLAYLSPEQTGRMNRPIDYRSDYYSLGATFFELFTGRVPFQTVDPMELVHSHMAIPAPSPADFRSELPASLCQVILKLLEKAPEDRYQSASGILEDLRACQSHVKNARIPEDFRPGANDLRDRFSIPRALYGRQAELNALIQAFERISRRGAEFLLVSGYSGIGKSTLIKAVQGPVTEHHGYFVTGKFDQLQRTVPYSALVTALGELVGQLLTESDDALADWNRKLREALNDNGQLVIDVIPEVEYVIGPQREVPMLEGNAARNRFRMVFHNFVRVFCRREHPLVMFLDDLQWADPASLTLLEAILADDEAEHLLLIGAYRDNEVDDSHPLSAMVEALKSRGSAVTEVALGPLSSNDVSQLLVDTLHCSPKELASLRSLVVDKTGGNPFFLGQFLTTLHRRKQLTYDRTQKRWTWDVAAIEATNITDNVVELMVGRLAELPDATQRTLRLAACIGSMFDLETLGVVTTDAASTVVANIAPAIDAGLIVVDHGPSRPEPNRQGTKAVSQLRFLHDRVQQAAYSLIDESLRSQAHLKIGRRLVSSLEGAARDRRLFEIVDHLNAGRELVSDDVESRRLAEINLRAASKAISATAYAAARDYAAAGLTSLPEARWDLDYELTKDLSKLESEAEYLLGNFERSQEIVDAIFLELRTPVERAELHNTLIIQRTLGGQYKEATETGREGLALLGVSLPEENLEQELERELTLYRNAICRRKPSDLLELPEMSSPEMGVAMQLLANLWPLCYIARPALSRVVSTKMVNLSLIHGNTPASAIGYAFFGQMRSSVSHEYNEAYRFGQLAMALADKFEDSTQTCRTSHVFCAFINHWTRPLREFDAVNTRGFQAGLQSGEVQFAGYHRYNRALCLFHQGTELGELLPQTAEWIHFGTQTRNQHVTDQITGLREVMLDLAGETPEPARFTADTSSEMSFVKDLEVRRAKPALCHYNIVKSQAYYLYNRIEEALRCADEATKYLSFIRGHMSVAVHNFYESLILVAAATGKNRPEFVDRVKHNQIQMREWAASCPDNFLHKCLLVDAELAQLDGNDWQAAELYDRAIIEVSRNGFRQEEALARECAGRFWLAKGFRKIAALYLREAHHGYQLWGASRKAQMLGEQYVDLLAAAPVAVPAASSSARDNSLPFFTLVSSSGAALDFATVMKASRALSGEIDLDSLLKRLLRIAVETAGAQTGHLLLTREDGIYVEATTDLENGQTRLSSPIPAASSTDVPPTVVNYVTRTQDTLNVADAVVDARFVGDSVIQRLRPRSILCLPIMMRTETLGLLYLAHNLTSNAFTSDRVQVLQSLAAQAAISLQNARLYQERRENEHQLRETLAEVQQLKNRLEAENLYFREEIELQHGFEEIVGRSPSIKKLLHSVETVAPTDATVLILGETGTGKELVARAIRNLSACKEQPFIVVNCAALPAGLVESELFGHEKGAFTGAVSHKTGRFELADRGTIFLDEIGELPLDLQAKLLRVLQEGQFERVGGQKTIRVNVRVIAATNQDLIKTMQDGGFREDLYYRLSVFPLHIPPLRERGADIPLLVQHFVQKHGAKLTKNVETIPQRGMDALQGYHWPGNVRELENVIERAMILSQGSELQLGDWAAGVGASPEPVEDGTLQDVEREHILKVLKRSNWQLAGEKGAARILGLKRTTLQGRMRKLEIRREP